MIKEIKTIKAAKSNGFKLKEKWLYFNLYPKLNCKPFQLKGHEFYHESQCEVIASKTWFSKKYKREVLESAKAVAEKYKNFGKGVRYYVYRISDTQLL